MTKYLSLTTVAVSGFALALVLLVAQTFTASAYTEVRTSGERARETGRISEPAPAPSAIPSPAPKPPVFTGGITSSTSGAVSTGGNMGGAVTTGDEHVEVYEVNIGPTNPPPPQDEEAAVPPPAPESQCDPRTRIGCSQDSGRVR